MIDLMLDSGAFTAWTQKKSIDLEKYCQFILDNEKYIKKSVNLDVIGPKDPESAAEAGMANFHVMRDHGINCMPVLHARESWKHLDKMLEMTDYIGLSGTSLVSPVEDRVWHRLIWNYVTDSEGYPIAKFHSFGNTSEYMALTMPWYSMDSATWMIQGGRAARIKLQGKSYQLRSNCIGDTNFILDTDTGPKRECWEQEIAALGLDPEAVMKVKGKGSELAMIRSYLVAADLLNLQEQTTDVKKFKKPSSLLLTDKYADMGGIIREGPVKMFFVISPSAYNFNFPVIHALGIRNILVSYYYIVTAPKNFWEEKMIPFMTDPEAFFEADSLVKKFRDKLNEVLLKPMVVV